MELKVVDSLDENVWREFVSQCPLGNIFHTPEMFKVFARTKGHKPLLWVAVDENLDPLALFPPVVITLKGGLLYRWTTRAVAYGSILISPGSKSLQALNLLLTVYMRKMRGKILFTELRNLSDLNEIQPVLNESSFINEDHLNYLIDLDQSEETLWRNISKSGRQSIRTSGNKGTIIEEVTDRQGLQVAYQLLQNVYTRVRVPLTDISLFEAAFDILAPCNMLKIFLARIDNHYIGTCFILMHKGRIIDWYAGSDRAFSSYCSGEFLIWHILRWGKEHDFHVFDFGGAGKPDLEYGPRAYKAKFGGTLVSYGRNTCVHAPVSFQVSKQVYTLMQRFSLSSSRNPDQKA